MIKLRPATKYCLVTPVAAEEAKGGLYIPTESSKKSTATLYALAKGVLNENYGTDRYVVALSEHVIDLSKIDADNKDLFAIPLENVIAWGTEG